MFIKYPIKNNIKKRIVRNSCLLILEFSISWTITSETNQAIIMANNAEEIETK